MSDEREKMIRVGRKSISATQSSIDVLPENGGVYFTLLSPDAGAIPTVDTRAGDNIDKEFQPWGDDNLWPTKARQKIEKSTTAYPYVARMVGMMFGRGFVYFKEKINDDGTLTITYPKIPEIDEFIENSDVPYLMLERMMDYKVPGNIWCEYIMNGAMDKITNIYHLEAEFTRFGKIDPESKRIMNLAYSSQWDKSSSYDTVIPFMSRRERSLDFIKENFSQEAKFAMHSCMPSPGRSLYAMPPHGAIFLDNGWLDYTISIPELMNKINKEAFAIKYHIQIPYSYWQQVHKDWDALDQDKRDKIIDDKLTEMKKFLTENKESAFISHFATNEMTGQKTVGWEITVLNDNFKKDKYLTSVQEGDTQVARALGIDTSMAGIKSPGGSLGAGSGSDKRVGMTNMVNSSHADILVITEPMRVVQQINGWDPDIKFGFLRELPTTLNETASGTQTENQQ